VTRQAFYIPIALVLAGVAMPAGAQDARQAPPPSPAATAVITIDAGRLTARLQDQALGTVLGEVAARSEVALVVATPDIEQDPVSADIKGLPLDRALRVLLKDYDTFFFYGSATTAPADLRGVWVYRKGTAALLQPVPPEAWASSRELKDALAQADAGAREQIYESLLSRPDPESQAVIIQALRGATEADAELRERLLSSAISHGVAFPPGLLSEMAISDRSEAIRLMALDALALDPDVTQVAQSALGDPSDAVRDRAAQILQPIPESAPESVPEQIQDEPNP
jgi:hypothetical protein